MSNVTNNQLAILSALSAGPVKVSGALKWLDEYTDGIIWTYDQVHSSLRRLEDRGLVRRVSDPPTHWEVTSGGRRVLSVNN